MADQTKKRESEIPEISEERVEALTDTSESDTLSPEEATEREFELNIQRTNQLIEDYFQGLKTQQTLESAPENTETPKQASKNRDTEKHFVSQESKKDNLVKKVRLLWLKGKKVQNPEKVLADISYLEKNIPISESLCLHVERDQVEKTIQSYERKGYQLTYREEGLSGDSKIQLNFKKKPPLSL